MLVESLRYVRCTPEEMKRARAKLAEIVTGKYGEITETPIEFVVGNTVVSIRKVEDDYEVLFNDLQNQGKR